MELIFLLLLIILMAISLGSGFPVAFALPGSAIISIGVAAFFGYLLENNADAYFFSGGPSEWLSAGVTNLRGVYWEVERDTLIAIPLFIFMGLMLQRSKIAEDLLVTMAQLFGPVRGGLGISVVFVGGLLAASTGIVGATVVTMGLMSLPALIQEGYNKKFSAGVVAAGGTLASLIPPSAILVIYAIIVEQDVGKLLLAGFIPGAVSALVYGVLIVCIASYFKNVGPPVSGFTWKERFESLAPAFPIVAVIIIIIFFVYNPFGEAWGTPTEGGAIGAFIIFVMAVYRGMRFKQLKDALLETGKLTIMIFTIIWGVLIYVRFLGFAELPDAFASWITSLNMSPILILICILLVYAVLGMFMDAIGMLLLTLPVVYPAVMALNGGETVSAADSTFGMSGSMCAIWFGILVVKMAEFCLITPPIGLNCFVVAGVREDISVQDVFKGVTPFFIADGLTITILISFPSIVLWLPSLV